MESQEDRQRYLEDVLASIEDRRAQEEEEDANYVPDTSQPDEDNQNADGLPNGLATPTNLLQREAPKKKKKKKKKSKTAALPEAGAELPDDYKEKNNEDPIENPYDPSRPLSARVEYAIWKYKKNHRFTDNKKRVFDHYLRYGGINVGPNAFQGRATSADQGPEGEVDWEAANAHTDQVPEEEDEDFYVSFSEVAQAYLGNYFTRSSLNIGVQDATDAPLIVDAFLRYLQMRNVCPEYADDLVKAREITALAKVELPKCKNLVYLLPGNFNKACSILYGGKLSAAAEVDSDWMAGANKKMRAMMGSFLDDVMGMSVPEARTLVKKIIPEHSKRLVTDERVNLLVQVANIGEVAEDASDETLVPIRLAAFADRSDTYTIHFEKSLLEYLLEGMVFKATMNKLDSGHWYLDSAVEVQPTFYMVDTATDPNLDFFD